MTINDQPDPSDYQLSGEMEKYFLYNDRPWMKNISSTAATRPQPSCLWQQSNHAQNWFNSSCAIDSIYLIHVLIQVDRSRNGRSPTPSQSNSVNQYYCSPTHMDKLTNHHGAASTKWCLPDPPACRGDPASLMDTRRHPAPLPSGQPF